MAGNVVDPEYEIFWKEVIEAVSWVENSHGLSYSIERGTRRADISWAEWSDDESGVQIELLTIEPKQPALIMP